jgi:lipid II:glycine glycyltransferase (peptidoglycan interpeptide bridge formation enzyme)
MSPVYRPAPSSTFEAWNQLVAAHPNGNLLQTTLWGKLKDPFGWDWEIVTVGEQEPLAGALVLYRALPMNLGTLAYVPRGPVVDWENASLVQDLLTEIERAARRRRAWACWIEPEALDGTIVEERLAEEGYARADRTIQPRSTILIDITPPEDDILMAMKSKTRYNIRLSGRKDVEVRKGKLADVETYYDMMETTGERDDFGIHDRAYYRRAFELFAPRYQVALFLAYYEEQPLAGVMAFALGEKAWYISGASSNRERNRMPTYALQWAAIRWAKAQGCKVYDLWGIPDADEETLESTFTERSDGLWGVYRFKRGFGGDVVRYTGLWERALNPLYPLAARFYRGLQ